MYYFQRCQSIWIRDPEKNSNTKWLPISKIQPKPVQREDFVSWYLGVWQGKYQASSDYLRLYLVFKMLQSPVNSYGVAADQVPGPSSFCTPSHYSRSQWRHMVIIFISISLPQQNNSTGLTATFDNSVSIKHSRYFQRNKLKQTVGARPCSALSITKLCRLHLGKGLICYLQPWK